MSEQTFDLTDKTLESQYSGLSELPEVKTPMEWLRGNGKGQWHSYYHRHYHRWNQSQSNMHRYSGNTCDRDIT